MGLLHYHPHLLSLAFPLHITLQVSRLMLAPYSSITGATPSSFSQYLRVSPNVWHASSLIDGVLDHPHANIDIWIDTSHFNTPVFLWSENSLWIRLSKDGHWFLLDTADLNFEEWKRQLGQILAQNKSGLFILIGVFEWLNIHYANRSQVLEHLRKLLSWLRASAQNWGVCIILLRFKTNYRHTWGDSFTVPRHPIQHFRHQKRSLSLHPMSISD